MWGKEDDDWMAALKLIPELFVACKILEKFYDTLLAMIIYSFLNKDFSKVIFFSNGMSILWWW